MLRKCFALLSIIALFAAARHSFAAGSDGVSRLPYLQEMTSRSVLIAWRTESASEDEIEYKADGGNAKSEYAPEKIAAEIHAVKLSGLAPDRTYWYRLIDLRTSRPLTGWLWFKTFPSSPAASFTFAVLGDSGNGSDYQKKVARQLFLQHPDLVIHTGDVIYGGDTDKDYDAKFFSIYAKLAESAPFFLTIGNHDVTGNEDPYLRNFYLPQDSPGKGRYYSFNCGGVHFVGLDSNEPLAPGSPQYAWLVGDLKASRLPMKVIFFHHPVFSSGYHGSTKGLRKSLEPVFVKFHVTVVFNGHDHDYERMVLIHHVTYVVTGGGGGMLYPVGSSPWTAFSATVHNFVLCTVKNGKIYLKAIDDKGKVFDRDTIAAY